jgi:hypothetical protein
MSTRMHFFSLTSIDPIRDALASNDDELLEAVIRREEARVRKFYDDDIDDDDLEEELEAIREGAESMIMCDAPPEEEPGCWNKVIENLAEHFQLEPERLPVEDWKQAYTWEPYRSSVANQITPESRRSLEHLGNGRPLRGSRIDYDGCVFGWLSADEVKELYQSLSKLDKSSVKDKDRQQFHDELVSCLKTTSERNAVLFLAAH